MIMKIGKNGLTKIKTEPKAELLIESLFDAHRHIDNLKSRVAKDKAIRFFINKFGWYI